MVKKHKKLIFICLAITILVFSGIKYFKKCNSNPRYEIGEIIDSLNHVYVYYNGGVDHVKERNVSPDGYNIGLRYQCVEFVKRYYYEYLNHKMPDSYGHAKDFYDPLVDDGELNTKRNLIQYSNLSHSKPEVGDIVIFDGTVSNRYGHVAIISKVTYEEVEIIQQNPGPFGNSREVYPIGTRDDLWFFHNKRILGRLRKADF